MIAWIVRLTALVWFVYIASRYVPAAAVLLRKQRLFLAGVVNMVVGTDKKWDKKAVPDAVRFSTQSASAS